MAALVNALSGMLTPESAYCNGSVTKKSQGAFALAL
jgi:hypothetical protein